MDASVSSIEACLECIGRVQSKALIILHSPDAKSNESIDQIRATFCREFKQESVMRVDYPASVRF